LEENVYRILILVALLFSTSSAGYQFNCGAENDGVRYASLSPTGDYSAKLIIVSFPEDEVLVPEITQGEVDQLLSKPENYFQSLSVGEMSIDFKIVTQTNGILTWDADLPADDYSIISPSNIPDGWNYGHRQNQWIPTTGPDCYDPGPLFSEILDKMHADIQPDNSLFFDNTDILIFLFNTKGNPFSDDIDGRPVVALLYEQLIIDYGEFYSGLTPAGPQISGVAFNSIYTGNDLDVISTTYNTVHEICHKFGLGDGPPPVQGIDWPCDENAYFYGNLNMMCQEVYGEGLPPIGLDWLHRELLWSEVIDFTGQNLYNVEINDIRQGGPIYKFRATGNDNLGDMEEGQYFLIAYHGGTGVDVVPIEGSGSHLIESIGLEINHCMDHDPYSQGIEVVDIESAFGLYDVGDQTEIIEEPPSYWADPNNEDTINGYDNYDYWCIDDVQPPIQRLDYNTYTGSNHDFFNPENKPEFSFKSNPSTHWYSNDEQVAVMRRKPQDVGNSMIVRITDDNGSYLVVDFLSAPDGEVYLPNNNVPDQEFDPGETVEISWFSEYSEPMSTVDIDYSRHGVDGFNYPDEYERLASDIDFAAGFWGDWVILDGQGCPENGGVIRLTFHNNLSNHTNIGYSIPFTVNAGQIYAESILSPEPDDMFGYGSPLEIILTSHYQYDDGIETVDFELLDENGEPIKSIAVDLVYPDAFSVNSEGNLEYGWIPELQDADPSLSIKAVFRTSNGIVSRFSEDNFLIYPTNVKYKDKTNPAFDSGSEYDGAPYSIVTLDYNNDGRMDFIMTTHNEENGEGGSFYIYKNRGFDGEIPMFSDVTTELLGAVTLPLNCSGCSVADIDNDGFPEILFTHETSPQLLQYDSSQGIYLDVIPEQESDIVALFENTTCGSWSDYDHDGDLDLYLGRDIVGEDLLPLPDAFLETSVSEFNKIAFEDKTRVAGFGLISDISTQSVSWCDLNYDGHEELIVSGNYATASFKFRNGSYITCSDILPGEYYPHPDIIHSIWADFNKDNYLDLVSELKTSVSIAEGNGSSLGTPYPIMDDSGSLAVLYGIGDYNIDGYPDVFGNNSTDVPMTLWRQSNAPGFDDFPFYDITPAVDLSDFEGTTSALALFDFNGDGDLDLLPGRVPDDGRFLQAFVNGETDEPENNWLGIKLVGESASVNRDAIGAIVKLSTQSGAPLGSAVVDGGSGKGSQQNRQLLFGLGSDPVTENIIVEILWPSGGTDFDQRLINMLDINKVHEIVELSGIIQDSIEWEMMILPDGLTQWVFSWDTSGPTNPVYDSVIIIDCTTCDYAGEEIEGNLIITENYDPATSTYSYHHILTSSPRECIVGCRCNYLVQSGSDRYISTAQSRRSNRIQTSICPITE
jgi:hypothetical protein